MERTLTLISFVVLALIGAGLLVNYTYHALGPIKPPVVNVVDDDRGLMTVALCYPPACEATDTSKTNCWMPSCSKIDCMPESKPRSFGTPCKNASGSPGLCNGGGDCVILTCKDARDNATVCAGRVCGVMRDSCDALRSCGVCLPSQSCDGSGLCVSPPPTPPVVIVPPDVADWGRCKRFWLAKDGDGWGWNFPFRSMQEEGFILTSQVIQMPWTQVCGGTGVENLGIYPVIFHVDQNPLAPRMEVPGWSVYMDSCHGSEYMRSMAVTADLRYQVVGAYGGACRTNGYTIMSPGIDAKSVGGGGFNPDFLAPYGIAQYNDEVYLIQDSVPEYLTGAICPENPSCETCGCMVEYATYPSHAPKDALAYGAKVVFGQNIIRLGNHSLELFALEQPGKIMEIPMPNRLQNGDFTMSDGTFNIINATVYGKLSTDKYMVAAEETNPQTGRSFSGYTSHAVQVFRMVGAGASASIENVTPMVEIPGQWKKGGIVSVTGKTYLIEMLHEPYSNIVSFQAYAFDDLKNGIVRAVPLGLPTLTKSDVAETKATFNGQSIPLATYDKGDASYLYLNVNNSMTIYKIAG